MEALREEAWIYVCHVSGRRCDWKGGRNGETDDDTMRWLSIIFSTRVCICWLHVAGVFDAVFLAGMIFGKVEAATWAVNF